MRQLTFVLMVTMVLSACGWESEYEERGTPEPSAPEAVNWEGTIWPEGGCVSDMECALTGNAGPCEIDVCEAGACTTAPAPVGAACDPGGLDECEVGVCAVQGEGVVCKKTPGPDGLPCMVADWQPPISVRTCIDGVCGAATECLTDADCADQDDGDLCNGIVACIERYCILNPASVVDCTDHPVGDCEVPICNADTGACVGTPAEDGLECDDGDSCTGDDMCDAGECLGETVLCETICDDEVDNDNDGATDCDDDECTDDPACVGPACPDGECNGDETCETCPEDCGECAPECLDGECNGDETCETCPEDCGECAPECPDGECNGDETCETCPEDCGECVVCNENGECDGDEDCTTCPLECGMCLTSCDGYCGQDYTPGSDCQCNAACFVYENCCDDICDFCEADFMDECNPPECPDGECNGDETCVTCPADCGECGDPAEVYFSEYVKGDSNNKAVEIYNAGDTAVDLNGCHINRYSNGDGVGDAAIVEIAPDEETLLAAAGTWVVCHGSFQEPQLSDGTCQFTTMSLNHNGDDALELVCDGVPADVIGQIGFDPGAEWTGGDPAVSTKDMTLRRMCSVTVGDPDGTDIFDPSVEWASFPKNTFDDLGTYVCD